MKLNLGSGELPILGYTNVDMYCEADVVGDMRLLSFSGVTEVEMSHVLEHIAWIDVPPLLERIRGWMESGAKIRVEVPDMCEIMRRGESDPLWQTYIYGSQSPHAGEFHKSGFTEDSLRGLMQMVGFTEIVTQTFQSPHHYRPGMPCLEAVACA